MSDRPKYFKSLVKFYSDPSEQRTLAEWARDNDAEYSLVIQYRDDHGEELWPLIDKTRPQYLSKLRREAYNSVFANVRKSHLDRKLALQLTGDLVEKTEIKGSPANPEEKRALIAAIVAQIEANIIRGPAKRTNADDTSTIPHP